jgi:hypothetical protein
MFVFQSVIGKKKKKNSQFIDMFIIWGSAIHLLVISAHHLLFIPPSPMIQ